MSNKINEETEKILKEFDIEFEDDNLSKIGENNRCIHRFFLYQMLEAQRKRFVLCEELPNKFNGSDLCAVKEDSGWGVGYESEDLAKEISATGKTLEEAFRKLNDYWFKSGRAINNKQGKK